MTTILETIFDQKRQRVREAKASVDYPELIDRARERRSNVGSHRLLNSLTDRGRTNIIAEFKKASPSKGVINGSADAKATAAIYERAGAAAISVLTEEDYFGGSLDDLRIVRSAVGIPILRKDFVFDEFQIYESADTGADAILLIVSSLDAGRLSDLRSLAEDDLGMDALVEVHNAAEMRVAADIGAKLVGVNNRNLKTFDVSLTVSRELANLAPSDAILVAESGLRTRDDLIELRSIGYSAFLIGETLMRSGDPAAALETLLGVPAS
jgi:indole-3-glycerol phosphate synthase